MQNYTRLNKDNKYLGYSQYWFSFNIGIIMVSNQYYR